MDWLELVLLFLLGSGAFLLGAMWGITSGRLRGRAEAEHMFGQQFLSRVRALEQREKVLREREKEVKRHS